MHRSTRFDRQALIQTVPVIAFLLGLMLAAALA